MAKSIHKDSLSQSVRLLIEKARRQVVRNVNTAMVYTYFQIGGMIVEQQQGGHQRAAYAKGTIPLLSKQLKKENVRGCLAFNLEYFRQFYLTYQNGISQTLFGKFDFSFNLERWKITKPLLPKNTNCIYPVKKII